MAFPPSLTPSQLTDFLIGVMHKMQKEDPTDIVTPNYPLFKRMESKGYKTIVEESPGHGPVRDIYYQTEDRYTELSASQQIQPRDYRPQQHSTRAQFNWIMVINTLTVALYEYKNCKTPEALVDVIARKKKGTDKSHRNKQVNYLWSGRTLGQEKLFGLNDAIRFTTTSDPTRGAIGGISVADLGDWTNKSANFNANYQTFVSGAETQTFLDEGAKSLLQLYNDCGYNSQEAGESHPDLIPCNSVYYRCCHKLARQGIMFYDDNATKELGVPGITFQKATIFEDRNIPNDPNNSAYGVAKLLNSNAWNFVYASGIRNNWEPPVVLQGDTAIAWDKITQVSIAYEDLGRMGVHYGVIGTVAAS